MPSSFARASESGRGSRPCFSLQSWSWKHILTNSATWPQLWLWRGRLKLQRNGNTRNWPEASGDIPMRLIRLGGRTLSLVASKRSVRKSKSSPANRYGTLAGAPCHELRPLLLRFEPRALGSFSLNYILCCTDFLNLPIEFSPGY
jgi:hypothetical protein